MSESIGDDEPVCICHTARGDKVILLANAAGVMLKYFHKDCPVHRIILGSTYQRLRVKQMHKDWCSPAEFEKLLNALRKHGITKADVTILEKKPGILKKQPPQGVQIKTLDEWCAAVYIEPPRVLVEWPEYEIDPSFPPSCD